MPTPSSITTSAPTAMTRPHSISSPVPSSHAPPAAGTPSLHNAHSSASRLTNAAQVRSIYDKPKAPIPVPGHLSTASVPTPSVTPPTTTAAAIPSSTSNTPLSSSKMADDVTIPSLLSDAQWAAANFPEAVNFSDFSVVGDMGSNCVASGSGGPSTSTSNSTSVSSHGSTSAVRNLPSIFEVLDDVQIVEPAKSAPPTAASGLKTPATVSTLNAPSAPTVLPADASKDLPSKTASSAAVTGTSAPVTRTTSNPFFSRSSSRIPPQPGFPSATSSTSSNITVTPVLTPSVTSTSLATTSADPAPSSSVSNAIDYEALYVAAQAEADRSRQELLKRDAEKRNIEETFAAKEKEFGALRRSLEHSTALQGDKLTSLRQELEKKKADIEKLQSQIGFAKLEGKASPPPSSAASTPVRSSSALASTTTASGISAATQQGVERSPDKNLKKRPHSSLSSPSGAGSSPSRTAPTKSSRLAEERALKFAKLREALPLINQPSSTILSKSALSTFSAPVDMVGTSAQHTCIASIPLLAMDSMSQVWDLLTSPSGPYVWLQSNAHIFYTFQDLSAAFVAVQADVASFQHRKLALSMKAPLAIESHHKLMEKFSSDNGDLSSETSGVELVDYCLLQSATILSLFASIFSFAQLLVSAITYQESRLASTSTDSEPLYPTMTPATSKFKVESAPPPQQTAQHFFHAERQALVQTLHLLAALGTADPLTRSLLLLPTSEPSSKMDTSKTLPSPSIARSIALAASSSASVDLFGTLPLWADSLIFAPLTPSALSSSIAPTAMIQPSPAGQSNISQSRERRSSGSLCDNSTAPSLNAPKSLAPLAREIMEPLLLLASGPLSELSSCSRLTKMADTIPTLSAQDLESLILSVHGISSSDHMSRKISGAQVSIGGFIGSEALTRCLALHDAREAGMKSLTLSSLTLSALSHIATEKAIPLNIEAILRQSKSVLLSSWSGLSQDESLSSTTWTQLQSEYGISPSASERDCVTLALSNRLNLVRLMASLLDARAESFAHALTSHSSAQNGPLEVDTGAQLVISLMLAIEEAVGLLINYWISGPRFASSFDEGSTSNALKSGKYPRASPIALEEMQLYPHNTWLKSGSCSPTDMTLFADTLNFVQEASSFTIRLLRLQPRYATLTRSTEPELWNAYRSLEAFSNSVSLIEESMTHQSAEGEKTEQLSASSKPPLLMWMRNRLPTCIDRLSTVLDDLALIQERLARSDA